jgi:outer membrane protein OmpA-like peptidoglycan-associated protein/ABC-type nitrate/sulfonate/bicarbonate transport system substrate-binding protein
MNKTIAGIVLVIGLLIVGYVKFYSVEQSKDITVNTSDAANFKYSLKIGVDSWTGYYPLCSKYFRSSLRNAGIQLQCINDNADLPQRFEALKRGDLDFAVATVDAYLALGKAQQFPGTIVSVIDESKGGDALVCYSDMVASIDELKTVPSIRVALTPDSPSEHLLRALAVHFDVGFFQQGGQWKVPANGSDDALAKLKNKQVDCAVVWEPDVTKALQLTGTRKIIGSEDTEKLIVDVLLASRKLVQNNPQLIKSILSVYFDTLQYYQQNPASFIDELSKASELSSKAAQDMLNGVRWVTLSENAIDWYSSKGSTRKEYLVESIQSANHILNAVGVLKGNPLPASDPYSILNSTFVTTLFEQQVIANPLASESASNPTFQTLAPSEWAKLANVGTLKIRKVSFSQSSSDLSMDAKRQLDEAASDLSHYPNFRILIKGHTGTNGDADANLKLSSSRAKAVMRYLNIVHGIDEARMLALGVGLQEPLVQHPNEGLRAYQARLPRVELQLKVGDR